jgi:hypothetical protein
MPVTSSSTQTSHQTVRLSRGRHADPADGACVMELASMLAGERFTDHPRSVCRVIAAFLRTYNDSIDDRRRQDLYRCAAQVVGTRASRATERARLARLERELADLRGRDRSGWRAWLAHVYRAVYPAKARRVFTGLSGALRADDGGQLRALALVDDLVHIDVSPSPACRVMSGTPDPPHDRVPVGR